MDTFLAVMDETNSHVSWSRIRTNAVARFLDQARPSEKERLSRFQIAQYRFFTHNSTCIPLRTFVQNFKKFLCGAQLLKTGREKCNQTVNIELKSFGSREEF